MTGRKSGVVTVICTFECMETGIRIMSWDMHREVESFTWQDDDELFIDLK